MIKNSTYSLNVGFILCPKFPMMSLTGFVEALRHAADHGDGSKKQFCSWTIMTPFGLKETASCGILVSPDSGLVPPKHFDYVAIIGPLLNVLEDVPKEIREYAISTVDAAIPLIGLCTGTFVLAATGLMNQRTACLHPYHVDDYKRRFPKLKFIKDRDFIEDQSIYTVPGGISVLALATHLIDLHCGVARSTKVAHQLSLPQISGNKESIRISSMQMHQPQNYRIRKAVSLMERHLEKPIKVSEIALKLDISERQLERLFRLELNTTPMAFWLSIRLNYGKWQLLNTYDTITDIAYNTGFSDCAHFIHQFKKKFGLTPGNMRKQYNPA